MLRPEIVRLTEVDGGGLSGTVRDLRFEGQASPTGSKYRDCLSRSRPRCGRPTQVRPHELGTRVGLRFDADACVLLPRALARSTEQSRHEEDA